MPFSEACSTSRYSQITSASTPASRRRSASEYGSGNLRKACSRSLSSSGTSRACGGAGSDECVPAYAKPPPAIQPVSLGDSRLLPIPAPAGRQQRGEFLAAGHAGLGHRVINVALDRAL